MKNPILRNKSIKSFRFSKFAISAIFISNASKINDFEEQLIIFLQKVFPINCICLLVGAIICLILGSGFFIFGENQKIGSVFLLIFLIPTTIIFHLFPLQQRAVLINLGLTGGLIISALRKPN